MTDHPFSQPPRAPNVPPGTQPESPSSGISGPDRGTPIVIGVLLLTAGAVWLADATGAIDLRWRVLLPAALIAVGLGSIALSIRGRSGMLIALGVVLSILVVISSLLPSSLNFRVGDQLIRPASVDDLLEEYSHGVGQMTIDLRGVRIETDTTVRAGLGLGELVVQVPRDVTVIVEGTAGIGEVRAGSRTSGGFGVRREDRLIDDATDQADPPELRLELSVGIGKVEVRR